MLQIKNVNLNVGNTALLSNINLTLEQGKIYGVLGPNGAGKTTLFKSMLGLTAFSGEILSDGQPVSSRCFGSLIEYPAFYPRLTVEAVSYTHLDVYKRQDMSCYPYICNFFRIGICPTSQLSASRITTSSTNPICQ